MATKSPPYGVFSDESGHTHGRFRCIAAVSLPAERVLQVNARLSEILTERGVNELKWGALSRPGGRQKCARRFVEILVEEAVHDGLRGDVLVWDTHDARHDVPNRDDLRNYERMFYHLHRYLIRRREGDSIWHLRPDEQMQIDWVTLKQCLNAPGAWRPKSDHPMCMEQFVELLPRIRTLEQQRSHETPLCQLADLLAGMARYTRGKVIAMRRLYDEAVGQRSLLDDGLSSKVTRADRARFPVISHLCELSRQHGLGVSMKKHGYLRTPNPNAPLNFWHYEPRSKHDKAPTRVP